jgi:hypothetical protein
MNTQRRISGYRIFSTFMACAFFAGPIVIGGGAGFMNIPALLITCGLPFSLLLGLYGDDYIKFIADAIATLFTVSHNPNPKFADIAKTGSRLTIGAGVLGTLVGLIQMLRNLEDPSAIGMGMSVALLTSLYAIFMSEVLYAFLYKAYSLPGEIEKQSGTLPLKNIGIPVILITWILMGFFVSLIGYFNVDENCYPESTTLDCAYPTASALSDHN